MNIYQHENGFTYTEDELRIYAGQEGKSLEEYIKSKNYENALINSHDSIGRAIFFTGITIIFGFSILILSNFIPTILFGLFTGLAMLVALLAVLTLLPKLIISIRPFG